MAVRFIYYAAASLDGYIADKNGGVGWLDPFSDGSEDYGYHDFYAKVDALVMGRTTHDQVRGFGEWPYPGKPCLVVTSSPLEKALPEVERVEPAAEKVIERLGEWGVKNCWIVGGGKTSALFAGAGMIDEYQISLMPCLLGAGIPLFARGGGEASLVLVESVRYKSGVVQNRYASRKRLVIPDRNRA